MSLTLHGGLPGLACGPAWWSAVHRLYDEAFPGLPAGIERAARAGVDWRAVTTPYALFEGDRCVAHVGLLWHPLWLDGRRVEVAGIHAVATTAARRRQGLCRRLLAEALADADARGGLAKLHTDDPPVYAGHGFVATPTWRFASALKPHPRVRWRPLDPLDRPEDARLLARLLAEREPPSDTLSSADPGWMVTIVAALSRRIQSDLRYLPDHDALVVGDPVEGGRLVVEVVAPRLPPAEVVLGALVEPGEAAWWSFAPDRLDPEARPQPAPSEIGTFMVRGAWPLSRPFGVSPLWEH